MFDKKTKGTEYYYICANIRAREPFLLSADRMMKMVEAPGYDEAVKYLIDCEYPDMTGMDDEDIERTIAAHRNRIVDDIATICPEPLLLDTFRIRYDYHNIKVLVKSHGEHGNTEYLMSSCGLVDPDRMAECYRTEDYSSLPFCLADALRDARGTLDRTGDPQRADFGVDRAYYTQLLVMAKELSDDFSLEYFRYCIDAANLRTAVRSMRIGLDKAVMQSAMIPGGHVLTDMIVSAAEGGRDLAALFFGEPLQKAAELGMAALEGGNLMAFDSECENALTRFLDRAKFFCSGTGPVLAFLDSLDSEIVAIRTILMAKKTGVSDLALRERLRESYV